MDAEKKRELEILIQRASEEHSILAVLLFGSHARGEAGIQSDIDICFVMDPGHDPKSGFEQRLAFMTDFNVDIHVYQDVPLYIRQQILRDGQVLFCRDERTLLEIACRTVTEFSDYEHIYRDYLKEVERG